MFTIEGFSERMVDEANNIQAPHPLNGGSAEGILNAGTEAMGKALVEFLVETLRDLDKPDYTGQPKVLHFGKVEIREDVSGITGESAILAGNFIEADLPNPRPRKSSSRSSGRGLGAKGAGLSSE
jgi:hypothetical protein